jgi:hypothetical protein
MKMNEILNAEEKMKLAQLIFSNTFSQLAQQDTQPQASNKTASHVRTLPSKVKPKVKAQKKAPMAPAPKPLPKPAPQPLTPTQIKNHQHQNQKDYAKEMHKTFTKNHPPLMPKSLQPLPQNIISPIGGGDPNFQEKILQAKERGEKQNRDSDSKSHFFERPISDTKLRFKS